MECHLFFTIMARPRVATRFVPTWVAKKSGTARNAGGKKMAQEIRYRPRPRAFETFRKAVPTSWSLFSQCPD